MALSIIKSYIWWDNDDVRFVLDQQPLLDIHRASSLNNSLWVDMLLHSDTLFWFMGDQSLFLFINES
jgi:hypothetical protein